MSTFRVAGINFDHFHMGDLLRMAFDHPEAEIVAVCDEQPERMQEAIRNFSLRADQVFTDPRICLETCRPDVVILCPAAARHGEWVRIVAPYGVHVLVEKPFAASLEEADSMVAAMRPGGKQLAINWPLCWSAPHVTAKRLIDEGTIGTVIEYHHYGGNRGPLWHTADKHERTAEQVEREKPESWFYKREHGGGSLLDYAGYGSTLGTWYMDGRAPIDVTCVVDRPAGLEVDEHAVVVCRYETGLSKIETRWGTFTDPWTIQPQPQCGFVLVGDRGTISTWDYAPTVRVQTREHPEGRDFPSDDLASPRQNPVQYFLDCIQRGRPVEGCLSVAISRIGQQIVDTAAESARRGQTLALIS